MFRGSDGGVEGVGLGLAQGEHGIEVLAERVAAGRRRRVGEPQPHFDAAVGGDADEVVGRRLGTDQGGVDGVGLAADHMVVDPVLDVRLRIGLAEYPLLVGLVLGKQQPSVAVAIEPTHGAFVDLRLDNRLTRTGFVDAKEGSRGPRRP